MNQNQNQNQNQNAAAAAGENAEQQQQQQQQVQKEPETALFKRFGPLEARLSSKINVYKISNYDEILPNSKNAAASASAVTSAATTTTNSTTFCGRRGKFFKEFTCSRKKQDEDEDDPEPPAAQHLQYSPCGKFLLCSSDLTHRPPPDDDDEDSSDSDEEEEEERKKPRQYCIIRWAENGKKIASLDGACYRAVFTNDGKKIIAVRVSDFLARRRDVRLFADDDENKDEAEEGEGEQSQDGDDSNNNQKKNKSNKNKKDTQQQKQKKELRSVAHHASPGTVLKVFSVSYPPVLVDPVVEPTTATIAVGEDHVVVAGAGAEGENINNNNNNTENNSSEEKNNNQEDNSRASSTSSSDSSSSSSSSESSVSLLPPPVAPTFVPEKFDILTSHKCPIVELKASPTNPNEVATIAGNDLEVIDIEKGETIHFLRHRHTVVSFDYSPCGNIIVCGCLNRYVTVWERGVKVSEFLHTTKQTAMPIGVTFVPPLFLSSSSSSGENEQLERQEQGSSSNNNNNNNRTEEYFTRSAVKKQAFSQPIIVTYPLPYVQLQGQNRVHLWDPEMGDPDVLDELDCSNFSSIEYHQLVMKKKQQEEEYEEEQGQVEEDEEEINNTSNYNNTRRRGQQQQQEEQLLSASSSSSPTTIQSVKRIGQCTSSDHIISSVSLAKSTNSTTSSALLIAHRYEGGEGKISVVNPAALGSHPYEWINLRMEDKLKNNNNKKNSDSDDSDEDDDDDDDEKKKFKEVLVYDKAVKIAKRDLPLIYCIAPHPTKNMCAIASPYYSGGEILCCSFNLNVDKEFRRQKRKLREKQQRQQAWGKNKKKKKMMQAKKKKKKKSSNSDDDDEDSDDDDENAGNISSDTDETADDEEGEDVMEPIELKDTSIRDVRFAEDGFSIVANDVHHEEKQHVFAVVPDTKDFSTKLTLFIEARKKSEIQSKINQRNTSIQELKQKLAQVQGNMVASTLLRRERED